jgi:basic amino acid/polyamine antiporter, APA family
MSSPSRLARRMGMLDAVVVGLGSMVGAGIFAALAPAAHYAGSAMLVGLAVAGAVAYCNATSSARLAALYPESGGTYVYGRRRLGEVWGYLAGSGFIVGKLASCGAMALTFAHYTVPSLARPLAVGAVVVLTAVNLGGIDKTTGLTRAIIAVVLGALAVFVVAALAGGTVDGSHLSANHGGVLGILRSGGILFFAFAGYARIATLGEEVAEPARTIPRAIAVALALAVTVYAIVAVCALLAAPPSLLASSQAPLRAVVHAGSRHRLEPVVQVGAAVASLGVLLSLLAGVSRTVFAMAADRHLPHALAAVHPQRRVPHRAELVVGAAVVVIVSLADVRSSIGFSSFCVLFYYAVANASALTLRRKPLLPVAGLAGCLLLAFTLPLSSVAAGSAAIAAAALLYVATQARAAPRKGRRGNADGPR